MNQIIDKALAEISEAGNLRRIPAGGLSGKVDLSSNDYLGLAQRADLTDEFLVSLRREDMEMTASASRLLAGRQEAFNELERTLGEAYGHGREALLFNSGYHANTGLTSAFAGTGAYILADKLVHASIIDGIKLSGLPFGRFRHNDMRHLDALAAKAYKDGHKLIIIAESVYSMDGDRADIDALVEVKRRFPGTLLYIDEAHGVGVEGPGGLGLCMASKYFDEVDILVGTLGKALASTGAYAILRPKMREFMVNKARSLIFSTALPPLCARWSKFTFIRSLGMDSERAHLKALGEELNKYTSALGGSTHKGHIQAVICGDPRKAMELSATLAEEGYTVLPIRTPTVPPGTDRLRISLSAAISMNEMRAFGAALQKMMRR